MIIKASLYDYKTKYNAFRITNIGFNPDDGVK
jgi:hypothetical protein